MAENDKPADGIRGALTIKFLKVPAWAWGLGLGVVIIVVQRYRSGGFGGGPTDDAAADELATVDELDAGESFADLTGTGAQQVTGSIWAPSPASSYTGDSSVTPRAPSEYTSNAEWAQAAQDWARINKREWSPLDVQSAISLWFDGDTMEQWQAAIVNTIVREFGIPPDMPPSPRVVAPKPATPKPTPTTQQKPGPVRSLRVSAPVKVTHGFQTTIAWAKPDTGGTVAGYSIERSLDGGKSYAGLWRGAAVQLETAVSTTQPRTYWRVAAYGPGGSGPWTVVSAAIPAQAKPAAPKPATPKPTSTTVTIRSGDTLWSLTQKQYGRVTVPAMRQVAAANGFTLVGSGSNLKPSRWQIGQTVNFPPKSTITF